MNNPPRWENTPQIAPFVPVDSRIARRAFFAVVAFADHVVGRIGPAPYTLRSESER